MIVPNQPPTHPNPKRRIAFVGECPGPDEVPKGIPFVGRAGYLLWDSLNDVDIHRSEVFVGNVCQHRAPHDKFKFFKWDGPEVQDGLRQLREDLVRFDPTFIVALGGTALRALTGEARSIDSWKNTLLWTQFTGKPVKTLACYHPAAILHDETRRFFWHFQVERIGQEADSAVFEPPQRDIRIHTKVEEAVDALRMLHGKRIAFDLEGWAKTGATSFALSPSATEAHVFPLRRRNGESVFREHEETIWSEFAALVASMNLHEPWRDPTALWIEQRTGRSSPSETSVVSPPPCGFITHNGLYDAFVLSYSGRPPIHHVMVDDTMVLWWELFPECDKALADLVSCLTREPYYKHEGKSRDDETAWTYNGKDTCLTFEACEALYRRPELTPAAFGHYGFNMSLLAPILYMELRGIRFDDDARAKALADVQRRIFILQDTLNQKAGIYEKHSFLRPVAQHRGRQVLPQIEEQVGANQSGLLTYLRTLCVKKPRRYVEVPWVPKSGPRKGQALTKRESRPASVEVFEDVVEFALAPFKQPVAEARGILRGRSVESLGCVERGQFSIALDLHFNTQSPKANDFLYRPHAEGGLGLPPQYVQENGRNTDRLTHDADALLHLYLHTQRNPKEFGKAAPILKLWLKLASLQTRTETLAKRADVDGRMRCSYNSLKSAENSKQGKGGLPATGRWSCSESAAGIGYNLQTTTKVERVLFTADEGCELGQWDLRGADGWTIAAECLALGDPTMFEDLKAGIKPAQVSELIYLKGPVINTLPRNEVQALCKAVPDDWLYLTFKKVIWGTCYLMGVQTMVEQVLGESYASGGQLVFVTAAQCKKVQRAILTRYPGIERRWKAVGDHVMREGWLESASGHRRCFYGQRWDWKEQCDGSKVPVIKRTVHGSALSNAPQETTTYATKLALWRLYYSQENRV